MAIHDGSRMAVDGGGSKWGRDTADLTSMWMAVGRYGVGVHGQIQVSVDGR